MIAINPEGKHSHIIISIYKFQSRILQYVDCYKLSLTNRHFTNLTQYSFVTLSP